MLQKNVITYILDSIHMQSSHIPTSFVPLPPRSSQKRQRRLDFSGAFGFVAFGIFALVSFVALSVFLYQMYLQHNLALVKKDTQTTQQSFNTAPIQKIAILNNQLLAAQGLLDNHVTLSRFLDALSVNTPKNVRFTSLKIIVNKKTKATSMQADGVARDFTTLVVESRTLKSNKDLSNISFSNITIDNKTGDIKFTVSGTISKKLSGNFSALVSNLVTTATTTATTTNETTSILQPVTTTTP